MFPAMEERVLFAKADLTYLANLCHNCGECLYACQFAPPHEFGINVPQTLARIRVRSYENHSWPPALGAAFRHHGVATALGLVGRLTLLMLVATWIMNPEGLRQPSGDFYAVVPHGVMVSPLWRCRYLRCFSRWAWGPVGSGVRFSPAPPSRPRVWMVASARQGCQSKIRGMRSATRSHCVTSTPRVSTAPRRRIRVDRGAAGSTTARCTVSCCASRPPPSPRSTTSSSDGTRRTPTRACPCCSGR